MEFTKVPANTFETIQMNAGIIATSFVPSTGVVDGIMGATTGGFTFKSNPTFEDFGSDVDNVPANTKQLKRVMAYDPAASGNFVTVTAASAKSLAGAADVSGTKITPRASLQTSDFADVWIIGDYSDKNEGAANAGYVAIHIIDALNIAGFQWSTTKDGKGQFAFDFHGHYDLTDIDTVPFEIYVKAGTA